MRILLRIIHLQMNTDEQKEDEPEPIAVCENLMANVDNETLKVAQAKAPMYKTHSLYA